MEYLAICAGIGLGVLLHRVERRLKIEPGLLLLVYLFGFVVGCLIGG